MAREQKQNPTPEQAPGAAPVSWAHVWQLPAAVASAGLVLVAVVLMFTTRPSIDFPEVLREVKRLGDAGEYEAAIDKLVQTERHRAGMTEENIRQFLVTRSDLFYARQLAAGGDATRNLTQAVEGYVDAEKIGATLTPQQVFQMADALIRLGRADEAPPLIERLPPTAALLRQRLIKSLVDQNLAMSEDRYAETVDLLMKLMTEPDLAPEDRIWTYARLTELRLGQGFVNEAIDKLLVAMQQLRADGIRDFPELYLLLGRGYFELGHYARAEEHLQTAAQGLSNSSALRGEALLLQARIVQQRQQWDEAYQMLDDVVVTYPGTRAYLPALMARAEVQAQLGNHNESVNDYHAVARAVEAARQRPDETPQLTPRQVCTSLLVWHDRRRDDGRLLEALEFAKLAESLYPAAKDMPQDLVLRLAETNWALGDHTLADAWSAAGIQLDAEGLPVQPDDASRVDAATRRQAQHFFLDGGEYYRLLAEMAIQLDPDAAAESLRWAAKCFDRGGEYLVAVQCLKEFVRLSAGQPRELWGVHMLGRSYQSLGDYEGAIAQFRALIADHHNSIEAHRSYVPLAQCCLRLERPNPAEAERLLTHVVDGGAELDPDAWEFADALIELGSLYSHAAEYPMPRPAAEYYPEAIRRLTEAIERYPNDSRQNDLHYELAHAYRLSAKSIEDELELERPEAERIQLNQTRDEHLAEAARHYAAAIAGYESIEPYKRSPEVSQNLKFAAFWRADCAFDQGSYHEAIRLYSGVADRYSEDATAIVALIQIVNAYAALDDLPAARTAQNRAWRLLRDLPAAAFESSPLPLDRDAWERVLRSNEMTAQGNLTSAESPSP